MPVRIAIADDSAAIRSAVRTFIQSNTNWEICGEAENGEAAVFLVQRLKPDLLVLDLSMPVMNGLDAARKIAVVSPSTAMVMFTGHGCDQVLEDAKSVGIRVVVPKDANSTLQRLLAALQEANDTLRAA